MLHFHFSSVPKFNFWPAQHVGQVQWPEVEPGFTILERGVLAIGPPEKFPHLELLDICGGFGSHNGI